MNTEQLRFILNNQVGNGSTKHLFENHDENNREFNADDFLNENSPTKNAPGIEEVEDPNKANCVNPSLSSNNSENTDNILQSNSNTLLYLTNIEEKQNENLIVYEIEDTVDSSFDQKLFDTLLLIDKNNASFLYPFFVSNNIKQHQIRYLEDYHIQNLVPRNQLGVMAEFQFKLKIWKNSSIENVSEENEYLNIESSGTKSRRHIYNQIKRNIGQQMG